MTTILLPQQPHSEFLAKLRTIGLGLGARGAVGLGLATQRGGAAVPYSTKILNLFGSALVGYYPLNEISGTTIYDASGNSRNGALSGSYTLGQTGIGDSGTAIEFNAGQASIYDGLRAGSPWDIFAEGSMFGWMQIIDSAVWSDWVMRCIASVQSDWATSSAHKVGKAHVPDTVRYTLGPPSYIEYAVGHPTNWRHIGVAWSQAANKTYLYWDGVAVSNCAWISLASTYTQVLVSDVFKGRLAHVAFLNRAATSGEMLIAATL